MIYVMRKLLRLSLLGCLCVPSVERVRLGEVEGCLSALVDVHGIKE